MLCTLFLFLYLEEGNTGVIVLVQLHWGGGEQNVSNCWKEGRKKKSPRGNVFIFIFIFWPEAALEHKKKKKMTASIWRTEMWKTFHHTYVEEIFELTRIPQKRKQRNEKERKKKKKK